MGAGSASSRCVAPFKIQIFSKKYQREKPYIIVYIDAIIRNARGRFPELASVHDVYLDIHAIPAYSVHTSTCKYMVTAESHVCEGIACM